MRIHYTRLTVTSHGYPLIEMEGFEEVTIETWNDTYKLFFKTDNAAAMQSERNFYETYAVRRLNEVVIVTYLPLNIHHIFTLCQPL